MYVCIYIRMYVCMRVCMYVRMYVRMYVCMYICVYVRMYIVCSVFVKLVSQHSILQLRVHNISKEREYLTAHTPCTNAMRQVSPVNYHILMDLINA